MRIELTDNLKGKCLVALPKIKDDIFEQSVIYITGYSSINGAVGVMINKNLSKRQRQASISTSSSVSTSELNPVHEGWQGIPLYFGGPVELLNGFVLYPQPGSANLILSSHLKQVQQLFVENKTQPVMLTAGYCMWESLQLERELRLDNWLVIDQADYLLHEVEAKKRYSEALRLAGVHNLALLDWHSSGSA